MLSGGAHQLQVHPSFRAWVREGLRSGMVHDEGQVDGVLEHGCAGGRAGGGAEGEFGAEVGEFTTWGVVIVWAILRWYTGKATFT